MRLTAAGERLRGWARRLLDQADQARRDVQETRPVLRLGALETIAAVHVPAVLTRLAERRPDLVVEVRSDGARDRLMDAVAAADLDAALLLDTGNDLGGLGFGAPAAPLAFLDLGPVPLVLVAAPDHPLAAAPRLRKEDLYGRRLLVNVPACSFWLAGERLLGDRVERVRAGGVPVMRAWAERGFGIALLPWFAVADQVTAGVLARLAFDVPGLNLRLVWRADREALPGLREMLYASAASEAAGLPSPADEGGRLAVRAGGESSPASFLLP